MLEALPLADDILGGRNLYRAARSQVTDHCALCLIVSFSVALTSGSHGVILAAESDWQNAMLLRSPNDRDVKACALKSKRQPWKVSVCRFHNGQNPHTVKIVAP